MNASQGMIVAWATTALRGAVGELSAFARMIGELPWRSSACDSLGESGSHPVPVVFVHGLLGDLTNFAVLRRHLARHGIRCVSSFVYRPRLDFHRLAPLLDAHIAAVLHDTGAQQVDLVGHSLGGLVARYFVESGGASRVRRLVTLGTPRFSGRNPPQELAIFAEQDALVPPPVDRGRRRMRVIARCGHLGLLTDPRALGAVTYHLRRPRLEARSARLHPRLTAA